MSFIKKIKLIIFISIIFSLNEKIDAESLEDKSLQEINLLEKNYSDIDQDNFNHFSDFKYSKSKYHSRALTEKKINIEFLKDFLIEEDYPEYNLVTKKIENFSLSSNDIKNKIMENEEEEIDFNSSTIKQNSVEIESDTQLQIQGKFIAKGNVILRSKDLILFANYLEYNKSFQYLLIRGDISIIRNKQYIKAKELNYDFVKKSGYIIDVYGSLDFQNFLNSNNFSESDPEINLDNIDKAFNIRNAKLQDSSQLDIYFKRRRPAFENFNLKKWRFKTGKIVINDNIWTSKKLFLTNDPFNKPQLEIEAIDFEAKRVDKYNLYTSKMSYLILEDKIKIPIGPRTIKGDKPESKRKWGILYDKNQKDGFYIVRSFEKYYLDKDKNLSLDFKPQFLLQRSIKGSTSTMAAKDDSYLSSNIKQNTGILDYFALDNTFQAKLNKWDFDLETKLNSIDFNRIKHSLRAKSLLSRNILKKNNSNLVFQLFGKFRENVWNGSIGDKDIIKAYGLKLRNENAWGNKKVNTSLIGSLSYGYYEAEGSELKNQLINRRRLVLNLKRQDSFRLWNPEKDKFIDKTFKYTSEEVSNGLFLDLISELDILQYSDGFAQKTLSFQISPTFIFGNLKRDYLDYFYLTVAPKVRFKNGHSPFKFDEAVDNRIVEINSKFQLYGPFLIGYQASLNLDEDSSDYRKLINKQLSISFSRRAYNTEIYYMPTEKIGGLKFNIYSFNFDGLGDKF